MPKKPKNTREKKDVADQVIMAALDLAVRKGWVQVTLADVAKKSKISLKTLREHFDDKHDIVAAISRLIDRRVLGNVGDVNPKIPEKERIFDILMERFDALNDYREGIVAILESFTSDPKQAVLSLPHVCRSMNWMLEAAGVSTSGLGGAVKLAGLSAIYVKTLRVWKGDDSADLSRTMAALDKDLGRAEQLANRLGFQ